MGQERAGQMDQKRTGRRVVQKGHIIDYCVDDILSCDGRLLHYDFISHNGAAAVIPVTDDGQIIMVRQWRDAIDRFTLEIPAGGLESKDEPAIECAKREMAEETGYRSEKIEFLKTIQTAPAYTNERIDVFVAFDLKKGETHPDPDEHISVEKHPVKELVEMIFDDRITDGKTVSSILAYYVKYCLV